MKNKSKNKDPKNCGIYMWLCIPSGKCYIGKSKNLHARKLSFLNFNSPYSGIYINKARKKYNSSEYWEYKILEYCSPNELNDKEQMYIYLYNTFDNELGYNLSTGGEGGSVVSESTKKRLSEVRRGEKNHFYNKHHTEETKRKIAERNSKQHILQYDLEGNFIKEWISAGEVERNLKICSSCVLRCCNSKALTAGNYQWKFKDSDVIISSIIPIEERPVYQIDSSTGEIIKEWSNPTEIVNVLNIRRDGLMKCLYKVLKRCYKYYWCYVDEYDDFSFKSFKVNVPRRAIYQIDRYTKEIINEWESANEAASKLNLNPSNISGCCYGYSITAGGYRWCFVEDIETINKSMGRNTGVYQIDRYTKEIIKEWDSATEAGELLQIKAKAIRKCCNGKQKIYYGYIWQYKGNPKPYNKINKVKRPVYQIDLETDEIIAKWESATEAERELNVKHSSIAACCIGKLNKTGGFKWRYAEPENPDPTDTKPETDPSL